MSDYDANRSDATSSNDTLDDGAANNSIIGKVKSRVSSIFPQSLSKWFSPSTKSANNNDSINGGTNLNNSDVVTNRRRRRIVLDEDDDDDDAEEEEDDDHGIVDRRQQRTGENSLRLQLDANTDEDSNHSDDLAATLPSIHVRRAAGTTSTAVRQPPAKRQRFAYDLANARNTPLMPRAPLQTSTPSVGPAASCGSSGATVRGGHIAYPPASSHRYTQLNPYSQHSKVAPSYDFSSALAGRTDAAVPQFDTSALTANAATVGGGVSSRRSLNIPSHGAADGHGTYSSMRRQILESVAGKQDDFNDTNASHAGLLPSRTSTTILEIENCDDDDDDEDDDEPIIVAAAPKLNDGHGGGKYNGRGSAVASAYGKRQRLINGAADGDANVAAIGNAEMLADSASDSSEGGVGGGERGNGQLNRQRKTGLFNMSGANSSRNGSRTSSFGNGLNFYSHLEGRKSLFAGGAPGQSGSSNTLNNSTLSLTSLNRRQFNASIYGSSLALSDSRLLNTFSPFYKGRTTYGGAAAYNKFGAGSGSGANASSAMRITPTLIRPTSSLSTLSSSNNSLAAAASSGAPADTGAAISSTAKRILDLINEFSTPLSEAKKMASSLKTNAQQQQQQQLKQQQSQQHQQQLILPQNRARLCEADLETTRAMRLSQVRTPYMRPMVMLQPTHANGKLQLPPVRELQVPSMSQLLQMKKLQSTTERSRQIATQNSSSATVPPPPPSCATARGTAAATSGEYTLPQGQQHNNKMRNKVSANVRITGSKQHYNNSNNDDDDDLTPPLNLPTIAFPAMLAVPKIDIHLPSNTKTFNTTPTTTATTPITIIQATNTTTTTTSAAAIAPAMARAPLHYTSSSASSSGATPAMPTTKAAATGSIFAFNPNPTKRPVATDTATAATTSHSTSPTAMAATASSSSWSQPSTSASSGSRAGENFKFSAPVHVTASSPAAVHSADYQFKFSPPNAVAGNAASPPRASTSKAAFGVAAAAAVTSPQLKSGSVLDALKQPFMATASAAATSASKPTVTPAISASGFGAAFQKSASEWDCDTCMVRNKAASVACVACETPRKTAAVRPLPPPSTAAAPISSFGAQFRKAADEWECDCCMLSNKQDARKCVACEAPRKCAVPPSATTTTSTSTATASSSGMSFGAQFKKSASEWECDACMLRNKSDAAKCVACETPRPGGAASNAATSQKAPAPVTAFKFGFAAAGQPAAAAAGTKPADDAFKAIASAQKSAKWECEACMTLNEAARGKCVCCEQAKPGTQPTTPTDGAPKFAFGASAAGKFSFGFAPALGGTAANTAAATTTATTTLSTPAATTTTTTQKTDAAPAQGFIFGAKPAGTTAATTGFAFGLKPATATTTISTTSAASKDTMDAGSSKTAPATTVAPALGGFKFDLTASSSGSKAPATATAGFSFGLPSSTAAATSGSLAASPVKFTLPTAAPAADSAATAAISSSEGAAKTASSPFRFGVAAVSTTTPAAVTAVALPKPAASFSFGTPTAKPGAPSTALAASKTGALGGFAFKAPGAAATTTSPNTSALGGFAFKPPGAAATTSPSSSTGVSFSLGAASSTPALNAAAPAAAIAKPMFSFGSSSTSAVAAPAATGFSFGSGPSPLTASTSPAAKSIFGAATATPSTAANVPAATSTSTSVSGKVFGGFGATSTTSMLPVFGTASSASTPVFGAVAAKTSAAVSIATVNATPSTTSNANSSFGSFGDSGAASAAKTNIFGSFGGQAQQQQQQQQQSTETKPLAFASAAPATFVFGGQHASTAASSAPGDSNAPAAGTWAQSSFVFGSPNATPLAGKSSVFGSFGAPQQQQQQQQQPNAASNASSAAPPSIFGNVGASAVAPPAFGSAAPASNAGGIFGANTQPATATNIFGSMQANSNNMQPPPPAFGASAFGGSANVTPTFGTAAGAFGAQSAANNNNNNTDGASAAKKAEPGFNFGGAAASQQASGGFNFGGSAAVAKPAFNFAPTNQPAFNFTGSSTEQSQAMRPFQFGATPSAAPTAPVASVFNFSGGAVEATPNAPFQFNAGVASANSNIFAPNPSPGGPQSAQQVRRKVRAPIRRLTPR